MGTNKNQLCERTKNTWSGTMEDIFIRQRHQLLIIIQRKKSFLKYAFFTWVPSPAIAQCIQKSVDNTTERNIVWGNVCPFNSAKVYKLHIQTLGLRDPHKQKATGIRSGEDEGTRKWKMAWDEAAAKMLLEAHANRLCCMWSCIILHLNDIIRCILLQRFWYDVILHQGCIAEALHRARCKPCENTLPPFTGRAERFSPQGLQGTSCSATSASDPSLTAFPTQPIVFPKLQIELTDYLILHCSID